LITDTPPPMTNTFGVDIKEQELDTEIKFIKNGKE
jgi:hypothetical protein